VPAGTVIRIEPGRAVFGLLLSSKQQLQKRLMVMMRANPAVRWSMGQADRPLTAVLLRGTVVKKTVFLRALLL